MEHFLEQDDRLKDFLRSEIFPSMYEGRIVLFLGAGASIVDRKYLGSEIIQYYQDLLGINADTNDLVEFVDIVSARADFSRQHFDNFIENMLSKLKPTETHKQIVASNWTQIITTNLDLLLERAYDQTIGTSDANKQLKVVRSAHEYYGTIGSNFIKYIKINGCIKDKNAYPFIFSSKDFEYAKPFHKLVLKSVADFTPDIKFMSIGYSYSDGFARDLLDHFDSFNFRYKRPILNIDPFVPDARLAQLKEKNIITIKLSTDDLFIQYRQWVDQYADALSKRKSIQFSDKKNQLLSVPKTLKLSLGSNLIQLSDDSRVPTTQAKLFYQGERPTYDAVRRNFDVVKKQKIDFVKQSILKAAKKGDEKLLPVIFLTGYFGSGKSTFLYRMIHNLLHDDNFDGVAFEFFEPAKIKPQDIGTLFGMTNAKNIILTCQEIELDSLFKELMAFRTQLSAEQFSTFNIVFLVSIRENILIKFLKSYSYAKVVQINVDEKFNLLEAEELVSKLEEFDLVRLRDARERHDLANRVIRDYSGDSFVSLFSILKNRNFELIVEDAYEQLSKKAKEAFIYTSLLYQYKIMMPLALLMRLVSKDWEAFQTEILKYDSKDILIQEKATYRNGEPDIFFRTKHPIISEILVTRILKSADDRFAYIKKVVAQMSDSDRNAELFVDLVKALRNNGDIERDRENILFDLADSVFIVNPHFTLHYAMNLQKRRDLSSINKAINKIILAEGSLEKRNHRLIHRRAVLNHELAKLTHAGDKTLIKTASYIEEARELFQIKRIEDPFSSYSYADFINLELWVLNKFELEDKDLLLLHIRVQELFEIAARAVYEDAERIIKLKAKYLKHIESQEVASGQTLNEYLDELYENESTRPYALILRYNYSVEKRHSKDARKIINELEYFSDIDEVAELLFRYYGRNLHLVENRTNLFDLTKKNTRLVNKNKLRYHFYSYIAESYNKNFSFAQDHIREIVQLDVMLNPELHEIWSDENGEVNVFSGVIVNGQYFIQIRVSELQRNFYLQNSSNTKFKPSLNQKYQLKLHFYVKGIRAELLELVK